MTDALRIFSDDDMRLLQDLVRDKREGRLNAPYRSRHTDSMSDLESPQAPEVYIAYPQESTGIPALTRGNGTSPDIAGSAVCEIYQILNNGSDPEIVAITGKDELVYNISPTAYDQDWVTIYRDKFGRWLTTPVPGGGTQIVRAEMLSIDCGMVGNALVLSRPCGIEKVEGEADDGTIDVFDRTGEFILDATIVGKQIYAAYLDSDYLGTGTMPEGTGSFASPCAWEIFKVCTPGVSTACEPLERYPSAFTFDTTNVGIGTACATASHGKVVQYVSDDGCTATYFYTFSASGYTIDLTFTYGCVNGILKAELWYHQYSELEDFERYWTSNPGLTAGTDPIALHPGPGTCGLASGYILANKIGTS